MNYRRNPVYSVPELTFAAFSINTRLISPKIAAKLKVNRYGKYVSPKYRKHHINDIKLKS